MNYHKGFIVPLLLALIALLIIGAGAYVYMQNIQANQPATASSTAQTADWKTYTSNTYGFSFQYPQTLVLKNEGKTVPGVVPHQWWVRFQNTNGKDFEVDITENTPVYINAISVHTKFNGDVKTQSVMIGKKKGIRFETNDESGSTVTVRAPIDNHALQVSFDASYGELINSILATFTFTSLATQTPSSQATASKPAPPMISSVSTSVPIYNYLTVTASNLDPLGAYVGNGWISNSHVFVWLTNSSGQKGILWEGGSQGGNTVNGNQINTVVRDTICMGSEVGMGGCPSDKMMIITPGNYSLTISVDGRGTSNSVPLILTPRQPVPGGGGK